ncbi:MAG: hypothetical protein GY742_12925 [Hyphomicrobiales bacterium]|nr:hypothetical protein [Hyphomicrobiales bacterium]
MTDRFTHATSKSWFSRMGNAFKGILFGIVLTIAAITLLFWNEGRAVKRDKTLKEGVGLVISVPSETVSPANEGKLVHIAGKAVVDGVVGDDVFNVSVNAVRLERRVEMLQWVEETRSETRKKLGGGTETVTTYSYNLKWTDRQIDSSGFRHPEGHQNKTIFPVNSKTVNSKNAKVGAFSLNQSQIERVGNKESFPLTRKNRPLGTIGDGSMKIVDGVMYLGSYGHNRAGDVRISMQVARADDISVVAKQVKNSFRPYETSVGGTISLLSDGILPVDEMLQDAVNANTTLTWILRVAGIALMFFGLRTSLNILSVAGDLIPVLGNVIGAGLSLVSFLVALCLSFIIIAIAWIFYRPLIAIALIVIGIGAGYLALRRGRTTSSTTPLSQ